MKNVKRTYFEEGFMAPCYELEDGTVLLPFVRSGLLTWVTKEEGERIIAKVPEKWCHFFSKNA
jgi:hypothetical protein